MNSLILSASKGQVEPFMSCFRCGIYCTAHQVNLSLAEGQRIADRLGLVWVVIATEYLD
jgi:hypothetical protein